MISVDLRDTERIVKATEMAGSELVTNKSALKKCLQICAAWYDEALAYSSHRSEKIERSAAQRLQAAVDDLLALLDGNQNSFVRWFEPNPDPLRRYLSELSGGIEAALRLDSDSRVWTGLESDFVDVLTYRDHFKAQSPLEWLVGVYLVETFALNFRVKKGPQRKPYITFAMSVLKELRIKNGTSNYSVESIRRAARGGRDRRKAAKIDDSQFEVNRQMSLYAACGRSWKREAMTEALTVLSCSRLTSPF